MASKDPLKEVVLRNSFYRDNFRRMVWVLLVSIMLNLVLVVALVLLNNTRPAPIYFAATADGRLVRLQPLTQPVLSDGSIKSWVTRSVPEIYSLDFINYRRQLSQAEKYFTPFGWQNFLQAFNAELANIRDQQLVATASVSDQPVILGSAVINGVYSWKVQVPIMVNYVKGGQEQTQHFVWTLVLQRVNNNESGEMVGISQIVQTAADNTNNQ